MLTAVHRIRTADLITSTSASSKSAQEKLQQALASSLPTYNGILSTPTVSIVELSGEMRLNIAVQDNFTVALNAAYEILGLLKNLTTLNAALQAGGSNPAVVELVRVRFMHPIEGLIVLEAERLADASAAQVASDTSGLSTADSIATVSAAIAAAVATTVAAVVAGAVGGAVAGAAGGAAGGGAAAGGGGGGGGAGAGGVFPLMMGAQRLEMSAGLAVEKSEMQTGVAGNLPPNTRTRAQAYHPRAAPAYLHDSCFLFSVI